MVPYGYEQSKDIPGPQVRLKLQSPQKGSIPQEIIAILDTGAAITCVPKRVIELLGKDTLPYNPRKIKVATGIAVPVKGYILDLKIGACEFKKHEVVAIDRDYGLIGRDILNTYLVHYDGPLKVVEWVDCSA